MFSCFFFYVQTDWKQQVFDERLMHSDGMKCYQAIDVKEREKKKKKKKASQTNRICSFLDLVDQMYKGKTTHEWWWIRLLMDYLHAKSIEKFNQNNVDTNGILMKNLFIPIDFFFFFFYSLQLHSIKTIYWNCSYTIHQ